MDRLPGLRVKTVWMLWRCCQDGVWRVSGGCRQDVWKIWGGCGQTDWIVCGGSLEGVGRLSGVGVLRLSGGCGDAV